MNYLEKAQDKVLAVLAGRIDGLYLARGTALAKYYFHHRASEDLDFFTQGFNYRQIQDAKELLAEKIKQPLEVITERIRDGKTIKICVYYLPLGKEKGLKIDFVEDYVKLIKGLKRIDGIDVLSLEDIYLRKIYAICGTRPQADMTGRIIHAGRQEAKDFYDLYFLSHTFLNLSDYADKYCKLNEKEGLIYWYRTYNRQEIKEGLTDLKIFKTVDFYQMEKHFKKEIDRLIEVII